ncbi:DUF7282 domain-containing protein (plasmid) [Haloferacaceae archaeon DSL9]
MNDDKTSTTEDGGSTTNGLATAGIGGASRRTFLGTSALLGAGVLGAFSSYASADHEDDDGGDDDSMATVALDDQTTGGTWVNVASATLPDGGFVAIHDSSLLDGEVFGSVVGVSDALDAGDHEGIVVDLFEGVPGQEFDQEVLEDGEALIAMPHFDSDDNGEYDFIASEGEEDGPYVDEEGNPVVDDACVRVC